MNTIAKPRLLCVDDEVDLLDSLRLVLRGRFDVSVASSGAEALTMFGEDEHPPFDAVVSDMRMPEMNGATLLTTLRQRHPDVPRLLLSGQADVDSAIAAINEAKIFRFLTKPCPPEILIESVDEAVQQARLRAIERDLLNRTLNGTVDLLTDVLAMVSTEAADTAQRVRTHTHRICAELGLPIMWELDLAAMLCQIGYVAIPTPASGEESSELRERRIELTAELLIRIPRLQSVAALIRGQLASEAVRRDPEIEAWSDRELNAEILRLAVHFEESIVAGASPDEALGELVAAQVPAPAFLLAAVATLCQGDEAMVDMEVGLDALQPDMVLIGDLDLITGPTLAPAGMELTAALIDRVVSFANSIGVAEPVAVRVPAHLLTKNEDG